MNQTNLQCVLADTGLGLHNSGRCYLCCHSRKYLQNAVGEDLYLDTNSLEDAWNSPTRREIQDALAQGIEHSNCQACWDDEHAGKTSRRQWFNSICTDISPRTDQPQLLDLKMGNTCNMSCRTCNPEVSSQWYREDWQLNARPQEGIEFKDYLDRWRRITPSYNDQNAGLWETLRSWLPGVKCIWYYGAEPMLIKKNFEVLEAAVEQGTADQIEIHINSNGTCWSDYHEQLLSKFKNVYFDISIDDIGTRCGYIRYKSDWATISANLDKFIETCNKHHNMHLSVVVTVNNLNVYYLDEIYDYLASKHVHVNFNMLHLPWQLNIKVLPTEVKSAVAAKLMLYAGDDFWTRERDSILAFLNTTVEGADQHFKEFEYYTRNLDQTRSQSFEDTLPEFAQLVTHRFSGIVAGLGLVL